MAVNKSLALIYIEYNTLHRRYTGLPDLSFFALSVLCGRRRPQGDWNVELEARGRPGPAHCQAEQARGITTDYRLN